MSNIGLFFDTETTGFPSKEKPIEIVQFAAILQRLDGKRRVLHQVSHIVIPTKPIPQETVKIHGITTGMAERHGITKTSAELAFMELLEKADRVIAHNVAFDVKAVRDAWPDAYQLLLQKEQYCTMTGCDPFDVPKQHAGKSRWPKLTDAYYYFTGQELEGAHDAMVDTEACRDVYFAIQANLPRCMACDGPLAANGGHETIPKDRHAPNPYPKFEGAVRA